MKDYGLSARLPQLSNAVSAIKSSDGLPFRDVFSGEQISAAIAKTVPGYRNRAFPPDVTLLAFMQQALSSDKSLQEAVYRVNTDRIAAGKEPVSTNTAAYSDARHTLPIALPHELFYTTAYQLEGVAKEAFQAEKIYFKGRKLKVMDGSSVLMSDTLENQQEFPQIASQEQGSGFPIARIAAIFSLSTGAIYDLAIGRYKGKETGEHALIRQLFHCLETGDIVLGDAYYSSYFLMAMLIALGVDFVFETHGARKSDFRKGKRLAKGDHTISLAKPVQPDWMSDDLYALMPDALTIREVSVNIERPGFHTKKLLLTTSLTDSNYATKDALGSVYSCRWAVELNFRDIKTTMQMDMLRGKTPEMVKKEVWIHLLAYNAIRKIMLEAAVKREVLPWQISFKAAIQALNHYSTLWRSDTISKERVYGYMLDAVACKLVGNRPGRSEPRKRKRRPKPAKLLHGKRNATRVNAVASRRKLESIQINVI
jgi:putative transposase